MHSPLSLSAVGLRRTLATLVVIGQLLGTIGLIPVNARSTDSDSTPYPCKGHLCGCRTAAECWAGPCCCYTMREKLDWAERNGIKPPEQALRLASDESQAADESTEPEPSCCCHSKVPKACDMKTTMAGSSCCANTSHPQDGAGHSSMERGQHRRAGADSSGRANSKTTWLAGFYAQRCHGSGADALGLLNVGVVPTIPPAPVLDVPLVGRFVPTDCLPVGIPSRPPLPPPKV
jgi:hypothetical protein